MEKREVRKCLCKQHYTDDGYVFNVDSIYGYIAFKPNFDVLIAVGNLNIDNSPRTFSLRDFNKYFVDIAELRDIKINEILED